MLWLLFLLASLITGAVYVSIINDLTDIEEDLKSGKSNHMAGFPARLRWLFPVLCLVGGSFFMYFLWPDKLSCSLYAMSWIAFSLYSIPPVRLKNRRVWGLLGDACGAVLFPCCLVVSSMSFFMHLPINRIWFLSVAVWALIYGLRGILWHQFIDRENDIKTGINTFASKTEPRHFRLQTILLITIELIAFGLMLSLAASMASLFFLVVYFFYALILYRLFNIKLIIIIGEKGEMNRTFMSDYYQLFFPFSMLISAAFNQTSVCFIILLHMILFFRYNKEVMRDFFSVYKYLFNPYSLEK